MIARPVGGEVCIGQDAWEVVYYDFYDRLMLRVACGTNGAHSAVPWRVVPYHGVWCGTMSHHAGAWPTMLGRGP